MTKAILLCAALLSAGQVQGPPEPKPDKAPVAHRVPTPTEAVQWAALHIQTLPPGVRPHIRYLWDHKGNIFRGKVATFVLNKAVSHASTAVRARLVDNTKNQLWFVNLRELWPEPEDYVRGHKIWESLDIRNGYFHDVVQVNKVEDVVVDRKRVSVSPYRHNGRWYDYKIKLIKEPKVVGVAQTAKYARHCDPNQTGAIEVLSQTTGSNNAIMRLDQFCVLSSTTLDGGRYYDWLNLPRNTRLAKLAKKFNDTGKLTSDEWHWVRNTQSDQAKFLALHGANEELVKSLDATNKAGLFRSNVAYKKPRRIDVFYGVGTRPANGIPIVTITHDIALGDRDPKQHPIRNLRDFDDRAREIICVRPNGMLVYALFDDFGSLQDKVPDDIAKDHIAEIPYSGELQPMLGCVRCHGPEAGYRSFRNDVLHMWRSKQKNNQGFFAFDDLDSEETVSEVLDEIEGDYKFDPRYSTVLDAARRQYAVAVKSLTGETVESMSAGLAKMYAEYYYDAVTPQVACYELGYRIEQEQYAVSLFNQILPILPKNRFGFSPEGPVIADLRAWEPDYPTGVSRFEWTQVYSAARIRTLTNEVLQLGKEEKE